MKKVFCNKLYPNTELCVDLKTFTLQPGRAMVGEKLNGTLTHDEDDHFTFVESTPSSTSNRNPQVYNGNCITVTLRKDGSYHPNFKEVEIGEGFDLAQFAADVAYELIDGLACLVKEGGCSK